MSVKSNNSLMSIYIKDSKTLRHLTATTTTTLMKQWDHGFSGQNTEEGFSGQTYFPEW